MAIHYYLKTKEIWSPLGREQSAEKWDFVYGRNPYGTHNFVVECQGEAFRHGNAAVLNLIEVEEFFGGVPAAQTKRIKKKILKKWAKARTRAQMPSLCPHSGRRLAEWQKNHSASVAPAPRRRRRDPGDHPVVVAPLPVPACHSFKEWSRAITAVMVDPYIIG